MLTDILSLTVRKLLQIVGQIWVCYRRCLSSTHPFSVNP